MILGIKNLQEQAQFLSAGEIYFTGIESSVDAVNLALSCIDGIKNGTPALFLDDGISGTDIKKLWIGKKDPTQIACRTYSIKNNKKIIQRLSEEFLNLHLSPNINLIFIIMKARHFNDCNEQVLRNFFNGQLIAVNK